jgi:hypothetical protein
MTQRSRAIAGAAVLAVLPWALAAAGAVYAYWLVPVLQQQPLMQGIFVLAFWIAIACFATAAFVCADASYKIPWVASAVVSFLYTLAFAAIHGLR